MGECSHLSGCNDTVVGESAQANAQLYRLKHSLIERHSTDLRALLGCSSHVNNALQQEYAGAMLKLFRDALLLHDLMRLNGSICALH